MLTGPDGDRSLKLASFLVTPDEDPTRENRLDSAEVLTKVIVPDMATGARSVFRKVTTRKAGDHALVSVALVTVPESERLKKVRLTLGGVAPVPWRAEAAELFLRHNTLSPETIAQAARLAVAGFEPFPGNRYKVRMMQSLVEDALQHLRTSSPPSDYYDYNENNEYYSYE
jgi:xanthine dehydrogenase YagS FAD-binding subunit